MSTTIRDICNNPGYEFFHPSDKKTFVAMVAYLANDLFTTQQNTIKFVKLAFFISINSYYFDDSDSDKNLIGVIGEKIVGMDTDTRAFFRSTRYSLEMTYMRLFGENPPWIK